VKTALVINTHTNIIENIIIVDSLGSIASFIDWAVLDSDVQGSAEIGKYYDTNLQAAYWSTSPVGGYILDSSTYEYIAPVAYPGTSTTDYIWDSSTVSWQLNRVWDSDEEYMRLV
jgi:hypothetical protein